MHRLLVAFLSAFDALIAATVGLSVVLAPLTLLWVIGLGGTADWSALWPVSGSIWLLGNLVPLQISIPAEYMALTGIAPGAASFALTLAPLAFAAFTAIFAARSGARSARASAWITGVIAGLLTYAATAALVVLTTSNAVLTAQVWQAILFPALLYGMSSLGGAVVAAWKSGDRGLVDFVREWFDDLPHGWGDVPGLVARGTGVAVTGLVAAASIAVAVSVLFRGGEVVALFESAHVDALGATIVTLGQLAYLPTLIVWALSWLAGPGFAVGAGSVVAPAGTELGVLPGVPMLGLLPEQGAPALLLVVLVPVAIGAVAGWAARSHMHPAAHSSDEFLPRLAAVIGIAVATAAAVATMAALASGSFGPGRFAEVGPSPGAVAVAVGLEVLIGAAILLLSPAASEKSRSELALRSSLD